MERGFYRLESRRPFREIVGISLAGVFPVGFYFIVVIINQLRCLPFIMSRLSRANLKARESIFTSGSSIHRADSVAQCPPDLEECVAAIEDCCEEVLNTFTSSSDNSSDSDTQMREAQKLLRNGTRDHPRIMKVLKNERARRRILVDLVLY